MSRGMVIRTIHLANSNIIPSELLCVFYRAKSRAALFLVLKKRSSREHSILQVMLKNHIIQRLMAVVIGLLL